MPNSPKSDAPLSAHITWNGVPTTPELDGLIDSHLTKLGTLTKRLGTTQTDLVLKPQQDGKVHISITLNVPGHHRLATQELADRADATATVGAMRKAFAEIERQLDKWKEKRQPTSTPGSATRSGVPADGDFDPAADDEALQEDAMQLGALDATSLDEGTDEADQADVGAFDPDVEDGGLARQR